MSRIVLWLIRKCLIHGYRVDPARCERQRAAEIRERRVIGKALASDQGLITSMWNMQILAQQAADEARMRTEREIARRSLEWQIRANKEYIEKRLRDGLK